MKTQSASSNGFNLTSEGYLGIGKAKAKLNDIFFQSFYPRPP